MEIANELSTTRLIDAPPATVWRVLTERMEEWFCPKPWRAEILERDLRPGGRSLIVMHGPDGEKHEMEGIYLEVVPEKSLVFTDAYRAGWVPATPFMTGFFRLEAEGGKTRYTGLARHWTEDAVKQHEEMGFHEGWAAVAAQLAELAEAEAKADA